MDFTKIVKAELDSPRQELSNGGLGIVVALSVFSEIVFLCACTGVQSSCSLTPFALSTLP